MSALAYRYALFNPLGEAILNAVGIWTDPELVMTYAGTVYGHDGTWQSCLEAGYTIRRVAISPADPSEDLTADQTDPAADVALLRAARCIVMRGHPDDEVLALALCTVERLDRDPQMLALAAATRGQADITTEGAAA
jgi:hypothetical protein